jgi:hypothetical protein
VDAIETEAVAADGVHLRRAADESDLDAGSRQHTAEVASDRARAQDGDARGIWHEGNLNDSSSAGPAGLQRLADRGSMPEK